MERHLPIGAFVDPFCLYKRSTSENTSKRHPSKGKFSITLLIKISKYMWSFFTFFTIWQSFTKNTVVSSLSLKEEEDVRWGMRVENMALHSLSVKPLKTSEYNELQKTHLSEYRCSVLEVTFNWHLSSHSYCVSCYVLTSLVVTKTYHRDKSTLFICYGVLTLNSHTISPKENRLILRCSTANVASLLHWLL